MTLKQLEYIIKTAEIGNITLAANTLYIAQPSLTHSISELENELGITIFNRTNKGVSLTEDGEVFLAYAREIINHSNTLLERFKKIEYIKPRFSVSSQHYSFVVNAFSDCVKKNNFNQYNFSLRETETHEIIEDVSNLKSEIGILYLSNRNKEIIEKLLKKNDLVFESLFKAKPHVFISKNNPLANHNKITIKDLEPYPYLTYEQGNYNSFYFSEEFMPNIDTKKNIIVRDRATMFNLIDKLNGYTVSSGIIFKDVNESFIIAKPFEYNEVMNIGYIKHKGMVLSSYAEEFIEFIKENIKE